MNGVDWIRLYTDFFDNPKIRQIKTLKKGDMIICVWINLLCLAGKQNRCGVFMLTDTKPYTQEGLANEIGRNYKDFKIAMETLINFEMVIDIDGVFAIKNWGVYQQQLDTLDKQREQSRIRMQRYRERQKNIRSNNNDSYANVTHNVTHSLPVSYAPVTQMLRKESRVDKSIVDNRVEYISKQASNLKKEDNNTACESVFINEDYDDLLDSFGVNGEYRNAVFRFISHLKVNFGLVMLNDRLESLIVKLDMRYEDDVDKVNYIDDAISKGYKRLGIE